MGRLEQTDGFLGGDRGQFKILRCVCNASYWQVWKISLKSLSGRKAFFRRNFECCVGRGVFARYV